jgi:hypothetical protein
MAKSKEIQISEELFLYLVNYFTCSPEDRTQAQEDYIYQELQNKLQRMIDRQLYNTYKTAPTQEQREEARLKYLDSKGIHRDWRW